MYIYICIYIYIHICVYTYMFVHTNIYIQTTDVIVTLQIYVYIYIYTYTYTHIHTCMYTYIHKHVYIHIHIYKDIYTYIYIYNTYSEDRCHPTVAFCLRLDKIKDIHSLLNPREKPVWHAHIMLIGNWKKPNRHPLGSYWVATVSRIDQIVGLFCRISSLL